MAADKRAGGSGPREKEAMMLGRYALIPLVMPCVLLLGRAAISASSETPADQQPKSSAPVPGRADTVSGAQALSAKPAEATGPYFGQKPPGKTPTVFAPGIVSVPNFSVIRVAFSPNGDECFFTKSSPSGVYPWKLYYTKYANGIWTAPTPAPFNPQQGTFAGQPFFSADGNQLSYTSDANGTTDIWVVQRTSQGWGAPQVLPSPVNSSGGAVYYSQTLDGTTYFASQRSGGLGVLDIWRARQATGQPVQVENLGATINTAAYDYDPCVDPNGKYLLFASDRSGQSNVYVSASNGNGGWDTPVNMDTLVPGFNTGGADGPSISPDGKYLFWRRFHDGQPAIYWVESPLREQAATGTGRVADVGASDPLSAKIQQHIDRGELAGVVTLIVRPGERPRLKAYGEMDLERHRPMRTDALFRIASMNKALTSAAALRLLEEGRFSLDDPVKKYIPELGNLRVLDPDRSVSAQGAALKTLPLEREITIRDLFRHTAGFVYTITDTPVDKLYVDAGFHEWKGSLKEFVHRLSSFPLAFQPGSKWSYSYSIDVLGYLIEVVTGQPLNEYVKQRVLEPLRMHDTDYCVAADRVNRLTNYYEFKDGSLHLSEAANTSPFRHLPPALSGGGGWGDGFGGVVSTAEDLGRFLQMLLNYGELDGVRILRRETVEMMISDQIADIHDRSFPVSGYGLGIGVYTDPTKPRHTRGVFWAGAPYNTHFFADFDLRMYGVFLTQTGPFYHLGIMQSFDELAGK
jgi:CubicO group peptidase (beta-lactamase class C family)